MSFFTTPTDPKDHIAIRDLLRATLEVEVKPGVLVKEFVHAGNKYRFARWVCCDCRGDHPEGFMATKETWAASGMTTGVICLDCFEKRLGRVVTREDFANVPMNRIIFRFLDREN